MTRLLLLAAVLASCTSTGNDSTYLGGSDEAKACAARGGKPIVITGKNEWNMMRTTVLCFAPEALR